MQNKILLHITETENINALHKMPDDENFSEKGTLVVMVHGFPGHKECKNDIFGEIENYLREKNHHTIRFDFRGCGISDGLEENFTILQAQQDLKVLMIWAKQEGYKHLILIAEGLGAALALRYAGVMTKAIVLLWPVLDPLKYYKHLTSVPYDSEAAKKQGFIDFHGYRIGFPVLEELKREDLIFDMKDIKAPATLIHGSCDKLCTQKDLELVKQHLGSPRIDITTFHGGDHGLNKPDLRKGLMRHIHEFIKDNI